MEEQLKQLNFTSEEIEEIQDIFNRVYLESFLTTTKLRKLKTVQKAISKKNLLEEIFMTNIILEYKFKFGVAIPNELYRIARNELLKKLKEK